VYAARIALAVGFALLLLGGALLRLSREGARLHREAEAAVARGDLYQAASLARGAAETAPTSHAAFGMTLLGRLAHESEARGDDVMALYCFRAQYGAALTTSSIWNDQSMPRATAEAGILRIATRKDQKTTGPTTGSGPQVAGTPDASTQNAVRQALASREPQARGSIALLAAGALGMALSLGRLRWRPRTGLAVAGATGLAGVAMACAGLLLF